MSGEILKRYVRRSDIRWRPGESYEEAWFRNFGVPVWLVVATEFDYDTMSDVIYYRKPSQE